MKRAEVFSYLYDFLSQLLEHEEILQSVQKIILFGSVVRGDFHSASDIDLFIDTPSASKIQKRVKKEQSLFEERIEKTWALRGITLPIKVQVGDLRHPRWQALNDEIAQYGKVVYGPYEQAPHGLQHFVLVMYGLGKRQQKQKMAFLRALYGYKNKKGTKLYTKKGMLEQLGGTRVGTNALLVPRDKVRDVRRLLTASRMAHTVKDVWAEGML